jgi:hypothetical protein
MIEKYIVNNEAYLKTLVLPNRELGTLPLRYPCYILFNTDNLFYTVEYIPVENEDDKINKRLIRNKEEMMRFRKNNISIPRPIKYPCFITWPFGKGEHTIDYSFIYASSSEILKENEMTKQLLRDKEEFEAFFRGFGLDVPTNRPEPTSYPCVIVFHYNTVDYTYVYPNEANNSTLVLVKNKEYRISHKSVAHGGRKGYFLQEVPIDGKKFAILTSELGKIKNCFVVEIGNVEEIGPNVVRINSRNVVVGREYLIKQHTNYYIIRCTNIRDDKWFGINRGYNTEYDFDFPSVEVYELK